MTKLAIHGGTPEVVGPILAFKSFISPERIALEEFASDVEAMGEPLSGYLAGNPRSGRHVRALEYAWANKSGVRHAIASNSATSGLLAACAAAGLEPGDQAVTTPYTMSATAAAPAFLGAEVLFGDIEDQTFGLAEVPPFRGKIKASIIANLFGHPAHLLEARLTAEAIGGILIEDNAQSPFARAYGRYAGTIGHIGVWSLNCHKHITCGEGGICTTDDDELAAKMRGMINHGECAGGPIGLNLRMTEVTAAIALAQLSRADEVIAGRIEQAEAIIAAIGDIPGLRPPYVRPDCRHVYYCIPFLLDAPEDKRDAFVDALLAEGVPVTAGYTLPLYTLPALKKFARACPVAERVESQMILFENCAHSPTAEQIKQIGAAFRKVAEKTVCTPRDQ